MSAFTFFNPDDYSDPVAKTSAARFNEQMNAMLGQNIGQLICDLADKKDAFNTRFMLEKFPEAILAANADSDNVTHCATYAGAEKLVDFLLDFPGNDINATGEGKRTSFMLACDNKDLADIALSYLAKPELNIVLEDEDGDDGLILAVSSESARVVLAILGREGIDVERKNYDGESAHSLADEFKGDTEEQKIIQEAIKSHSSYKEPAPAPTPKPRRARKAADPAAPKRPRGRPRKPRPGAPPKPTE